MAELERALVRSDYRVTSWNAVRAIVEHEDGVTPLEAAKSLGAQILFQVNSLEQSRDVGRLDDGWRRVFYRSDRTGYKGEPAEVPEERAGVLEEGIRPLERAWVPSVTPTVTVDVTAVSTETGEAVWFYQAKEVGAGRGAQEEEPVVLSRLFECNRSRLYRCLVREPAPLSAREAVFAPGRGSGGSKGRSGSEELALSPDEVDAAYRAAYFALLRDAMAELVREFTQGRR